MTSPDFTIPALLNNSDPSHQFVLNAVKYAAEILDDRHAQHNLAMLYLTGEGGLKKDLTAGIDLLRKAAAKNLPCAQYQLAKHLLDNPATYDEAIANYQRAMDLGFVAAQYDLAHHILNKSKNPKQRFNAIQSLFNTAPYVAISMLDRDYEVPITNVDYIELGSNPDLTKAEKAFFQAIILLYIPIDTLHRNYNTEFKRKETEALALFKFAATDSSTKPYFQYMYGLLLEQRWDIDRTELPMTWYRKAAARNYGPAICKLVKAGEFSERALRVWIAKQPNGSGALAVNKALLQLYTKKMITAPNREAKTRAKCELIRWLIQGMQAGLYPSKALIKTNSARKHDHIVMIYQHLAKGEFALQVNAKGMAELAFDIDTWTELTRAITDSRVAFYCTVDYGAEHIQRAPRDSLVVYNPTASDHPAATAATHLLPAHAGCGGP
jgi:TPR repeat protein